MPDYFTLEEFRLLPGMEDDAETPDARIEAVAASLTSTVERVVGTSFIPRTFTRTMPQVNGTLAPTTPYILEIVSTSGPDIFGYTGDVTVTYTAGYSETPPADIKEHLMWAVRDRLMATNENAGIDARKTSVITEQGTVNYVLAGEDRPTGYPDLDAAILGWHRKLFGLGFV